MFSWFLLVQVNVRVKEIDRIYQNHTQKTLPKTARSKENFTRCLDVIIEKIEKISVL